MSKSILVMDVPQYCADCPLMSRDYSRGFEEVCNASAKNFLGEAWQIKDIFDERPDWCPLKPMPDKKSTKAAKEQDILFNMITIAEATGWNDCIDELEGKEDEIKT